MVSIKLYVWGVLIMNFKKYNTGNHDLLECSTSVCDECRTFLAGIFVNSLAKGCSCVTEVVNKWEIVGKVFKDHNEE